jgi:hypothetical protein
MSVPSPETPERQAAAFTQREAWIDARARLIIEARTRGASWAQMGNAALSQAYLALATQLAGLTDPFPTPRVEVPGQTAIEDHLEART